MCNIVILFVLGGKKNCLRDNDIWFVEWFEYNYFLNFIFFLIVFKGIEYSCVFFFMYLDYIFVVGVF